MAAPPPEEEGPPLTELEGLQLKCNTVSVDNLFNEGGNSLGFFSTETRPKYFS